MLHTHSDNRHFCIRNDLDEARNRQKQTSLRIANMQHKLEEFLAEKNRLQERMNIMEKVPKNSTNRFFCLMSTTFFHEKEKRCGLL